VSGKALAAGPTDNATPNLNRSPATSGFLTKPPDCVRGIHSQPPRHLGKARPAIPAIEQSTAAQRFSRPRFPVQSHSTGVG